MTAVNPTDATDDPDREVLGWDSFGSATRELAETIARDGWRPDPTNLKPLGRSWWIPRRQPMSPSLRQCRTLN